MNKTIIPLLTLASTLFAASPEAMQKEIDALKARLNALESAQQENTATLVDELGALKMAIEIPDYSYERVSGLGPAASKVYHSKDKLSIGGYGEMYLRRYSQYDNGDAALNTERTNTETNILRFIPYIGYKFNDWIILNTELEWENGGAKPGDEDYNYAIVEFTYLDFLFDDAYNLRVGHLLVPMGNINLNHEPTQFLTTERPKVERTIIPSTWHTNGALVYGDLGDFSYHVGLVTAPNAVEFEQGSFIKRGRGGGKQNTDDFGIVARLDYQGISGLNLGFSAFTAETGDQIAESNAKAHRATLWDLHLDYRANGWDIKAVYTAGELGNNDLSAYSTRSAALNSKVASEVWGAYATVGYDIMPLIAPKRSDRLMPFLHVESLDLDAAGDAVFDAPSSTASQKHDQAWQEYALGVSYFPDPNVVIKGDYRTINYDSKSLLKDEALYTFSAGYIF